MKQNQISDLPKLTVENFENIFDVYQDSDGMYFYNLLNTVVFPPHLPLSLFDPYVVKPGDSWPFISYKTLQSPNLWWVILLANDIRNPLAEIKSGTIIKIPKIELVREVLMQLGK
jgi:hypothetical protein